MPRRPRDRILLRMLGARIRRLREAKGWSQEELGFRAGYERSAIQQYEAGETEPLIGTLLDIVRALEAEPGDLLAGEVWDRIVARADARKNKGS
jgi:transcriptional regulator with XRE-family HTH domain